MYYRKPRGLAGGFAVRMPDGNVVSYTDIGAIDAAFAQGATPVSGTRTMFMNGTLINGCPLNVVLGQGWIPGQQEALQAAGITMCLPPPVPPPTLAQNIGPGLMNPPSPSYVNDPAITFAPGGRPVVNTGVVTPSQPIIVPIASSGGPGVSVDFGVPDPRAQAQGGGMSWEQILPWAGLAIGVIALFQSRGGRG